MEVENTAKRAEQLAAKADKAAARVTELEQQVAALKMTVEELKKRPVAVKLDPEASLKYMRGIAEAFLTATLERNDQTMAASMTPSYKAAIAGETR